MNGVLKELVTLARINHRDGLRCRRRWDFVNAQWYSGRRDAFMASARILKAGGAHSESQEAGR